MVIPSCREGDELIRTIESINKSSVPEDSEIIIVENGSKGDIAGGLPRFSGGCLQTEFPLGVHKARAAGAEMAAGENLVFLDAHMRVEKDFVTNIEKALSTTPDALLCSASRSTNAGSEWTIYGCQFHYKDGQFAYSYNLKEPVSSIYEVFMPTGACYAMRRSTYEHIGGFPLLFRTWGVSEADLAVRAWLTGKHVVCCKELTTYHKYREQFPYSVQSYEIDYNWCVLALSLFEFGPAWNLFVKPALKRSGTQLQSLLLDTFSRIVDEHNEFKKRKKYDTAWLWDRFSEVPMLRQVPLQADDVKDLIENALC